MRDKISVYGLDSFGRCPRQFYYGSELGLRSRGGGVDFSRCYRRGLVARADGLKLAVAAAVALMDEDEFSGCIKTARTGETAEQAFARDVERFRTASLLSGYYWQYQHDDLEFLDTDIPFEVAVINPDTRRSSKSFTVTGKLDAIVALPDGRLAVWVVRTTGQSLDDESNWQRFASEPRLSQLVLAARALGYDVSDVCCDVTRKASIRPRKRTAAKDNARGETARQYGQRLVDDIAERPGFYYQRRIIPRDQCELDRYRLELWQQAKQIIAARRHGRWYRSVSRWNCDFCQYSRICREDVDVADGNTPDGFELATTKKEPPITPKPQLVDFVKI